MKKPLNIACKTPLPQNDLFFVVSTLWCQLFSKLLYWWRRTKSKQENITVDTVSTNICPLCSTYLYVNLRTKFKCTIIFVGMVTHFKKNSQLSRSVSTFLLTGHWNYCTQNYQITNALPQDIQCIPARTHPNFKIPYPCWVCLFWYFRCTRSA